MTFRSMPDGCLQYEPMPPASLEKIRKSFGLERIEFGEYLGYTGEPSNIETTVRRMETGNREIPPMVERLATLLSWYHSDHGYLPDLDSAQRRPRQIIQEPEDAAVRSD